MRRHAAALILTVLATVGLMVACNPTPPPHPPTPTTTVAQIVVCHEVDGLPDPACTPGALNPNVTQATIGSTICQSGWTSTIRPPSSYTTALKRNQMIAYGLTGPLSAYEEDHRVPLEVGGDPINPKNLWPEPWAGAQGAHAKDLIENRVKADVCDGKLTLAQGRAIFEGDWWTATIA